jgi:hypothetical protein
LSKDIPKGDGVFSIKIAPKMVKKKEEGKNWYQKEKQERLSNHLRIQTATKLPRKIH